LEISITFYKAVASAAAEKNIKHIKTERIEIEHSIQKLLLIVETKVCFVALT
jgi:hypothetical protein